MRIIILQAEDWAFRVNREALARTLLSLGAEVTVMAADTGLGGKLRAAGFDFIAWKGRRGALNPLSEALSIQQIHAVYRRLQPDLVHHVALKPVLHGGLVARTLGIPAVNHVTGLGHVFVSRSVPARAGSAVVIGLLRFIFRNLRAMGIVHNPDDLAFLCERGVGTSQTISMVAGSGVDVRAFRPAPEPGGVPKVILPARLIWTKGIREFVEAAGILKYRKVEARFVLVGPCDQHNPAGVPEREVRAWEESGLVEWWGYRDNMADVLAASTIVCLPSYREGAPKVLLEAAACGRPVVAADVPGCREVVRDGETGILVPPRSAAGLAAALELLLTRPDMRARMGSRARRVAVERFSQDVIIDQVLGVYRRLIGWPDRNISAVAGSQLR